MPDILSPVRSVVRRHKSLTEMMDAAVRECIAEGRADPLHVCVLAKPWKPAHRDVPQKWRDEAIEHLAVRRDAR